MPTPTVILKNVSARQYGKTVLDDISFELSTDQHLAIIGISGSGKSSLGKAIAGKLFTKGNIEIQYNYNIPLAPKAVLIEHTESFKNLSNVSDFYYQQRYNSFDADDALTVEQELSRTNLWSADTESLLDRLNLVHRRQTPLIQLSNGEQKKLQLIKYLLQQPQVLILDKVFTGLDAESRKELHSIINQQASSGTTIILITDEKELPACITQIAELQNGKLVRYEARKNFVARHPEGNDDKINQQLTGSFLTTSPEKFDCIVNMTNVTIRYGDKTILHNINWNVTQGERWLVKGHNGAGKSTLLSLITADNPQAYSQDIHLFDKKRGTGESIWDIKKHIGFVSPELHRYFDFGATVHNVIASGLFDTMGLFKRLNAEQEHMVASWTALFGMEEESHKPLYLLPAGQQRRALLARALIKNPALLVLDEPCQGLDNHQAKQFLQLIDEICRQSKTTLIFVSHYDDEIPGCITKRLELQQGKQIPLFTEQALSA
jgi:molybdate transport system ATP-binding protein